MENLKVKGSVFMEARCAETGQLVDTYKGRNLVVNLGKANAAKLIGGDVSAAAVTKISVGEGAVAPSVTDTGLTNAYTKAIDAVTYPTANSVRFSFSLGAGEGNGLNIAELGLITAGNQLFARKTRTPIAKTSAIIITGLWTITIN